MNNDLQAQINQYLTEWFAPEDETLQWIQAEAKRQELPAISIQPFEGKLLQFLIRSIGARKVVEIGTLAGYSAVWMARALPEGGQLITIDKSSSHLAVAHAAITKAKLEHIVNLRQGSARDLLPKISDYAPFDFIFIDADKDNYFDYLEWTAENLRVGGMFAAHNAIRGGHIFDPRDENDRIIAEFNQRIARDERFDSLIIPMGDGMAVGIRTDS